LGAKVNILVVGIIITDVGMWATQNAPNSIA
jgi:hypothetical protein